MITSGTDKVTIYTDGGARGNPGPAATGIVILSESSKILKIDGRYLGIKTNNQAEYEALIMALEAALRLGTRNVTCFLDSELAVKQLNGEYKVKNAGIKPLKDKVDSLRKSFDSVSFNHIERAKNHVADSLVNIVLDAVGK
jgi:ribonuclease HI